MNKETKQEEEQQTYYCRHCNTSQPVKNIKHRQFNNAIWIKCNCAICNHPINIMTNL